MQAETNASYWQSRYDNQLTGWDLGVISPPLKAYFDQLSDRGLKILIPGCGNAYEAEYLHKQGFSNVFVVDIAAAPLQDLQQRVPGFPKENLLHRDFFDLTEKFDLIIEQTFFCALQPEQRTAYARQMARLLKPGGKLVGLLFDTEFAKAGPPFGGSAQEYRNYFEPYFHFHTFAPAYNSIKPRAGTELFMILEKK